MRTPIHAAVLAAVLIPAAALADHAPGHGATRFTVRVENVSTTETLRLSTGATAPAPHSPVLWAVVTKPGVLFSPGRLDHGMGLEALAEDGDPEPLAKALAGARGVSASGFAVVPAGDAMPGPALPGKRFEFTVTAMPGERLALATMFGQSNDVWIGPGDHGIALFSKGRPRSGDVTAELRLWDQGTEVNEEPGVGPNQGPRQPGPNTGPAERRPVAPPKDGFTYPPVAKVVKVTITPEGIAAK